MGIVVSYQDADGNERSIRFLLPNDHGSMSLQVIDYNEHQVHEGLSYTADDNVAGGSGSKATISFLTPNSDVDIHIIISVRANVESIYTLGEGATVTGASGSDYAPRNQNRRSHKTSALRGAGSAGGVGFVTLGATVTDFGTVLETLHFGAGKLGGEDRGVREWVLARNTVYAAEVETQAASSEAFVEIHYSEQPGS